MFLYGPLTIFGGGLDWNTPGCVTWLTPDCSVTTSVGAWSGVCAVPQQDELLAKQLPNLLYLLGLTSFWKIKTIG